MEMTSPRTNKDKWQSNERNQVQMNVFVYKSKENHIYYHVFVGITPLNI
jgi:hypothetical protein